MHASETIIHANALVFNTKGLLIIGNSGSGKSDLSLRLIDCGAVLISDDYTVLNLTDTHTLCASCPPNITGLLEVRGIGIIKKPFIPTHHIDYVIELATDYPRMPDMAYSNYKNIRIRKFLLNPFEISVLNKIQVITTTI